MLLLILAFVIDLLKDFDNKTFPFGVLLLCLAGIAYMQRETGKRYKIPISKIISFDVSNDKVKILCILITDDVFSLTI